MITPFTVWDYPDAKSPDGVCASWEEWCAKEVKRINRQGVGRLAQIVNESRGRLKNGVARIGVARLK